MKSYLKVKKKRGLFKEIENRQADLLQELQKLDSNLSENLFPSNTDPSNPRQTISEIFSKTNTELSHLESALHDIHLMSNINSTHGSSNKPSFLNSIENTVTQQYSILSWMYNHITRKGISKRLIVAVDNLKEFHKENIKLNKTHYPYTARFFKEKIINFFSKYGARTHFNTFKLENEDNFKYGIIKKQDLLQDLTSWETLL